MPVITTEELFKDTPNTISTEELLGEAITPEVMPRNAAFLPGRARTERIIASRPDMGRVFQEEINQIPAGFIQKVLQPTVAAYKGLGALMQRGEAAVANPLIGIQEGNYNLKDLVNLAGQGLTGQRSGELGDIPRNVGVNDTLSSLIGMGSVAGIGNLLTKGGVVRGAGKIKTDTKNILGNVSQTAEKTADKVLRGGVPKLEAERIATEYGNSNGNLVQIVKDKLNNLISSAENSYKNAINSFKGNSINSQEFYNTIQKGLREKGWIDLQGNATSRFQSGLDPVMDKLTNLYLDLKGGVSNAGQKVKGQIMTKADFSTYRDALKGMLKDKPSDILVMQARNSLYNSAEKSGMTGIKAARNLEKEAIQKSKKFIDSKGDLKIANETKLNRIGTDKPLSQQEMAHIKELEQYVKHPISKDAASINKLNKAKQNIAKAKEEAIKYGIRGAAATAGGLGAFEVGRKIFR